MNWYYAEGSQQIGPVDQAQFNMLVSSGRIRPDTLVWHSGMPNWAPYSTVASQSGAAAAGAGSAPSPIAPMSPIAGPQAFQQNPGPQPGSSYSPNPGAGYGYAGGATTRYCAECGTPHGEAEMVRFGDSYVCGNCKNVFAQKLREGVVTTGSYRYAGFWIRVLALVIDGIILSVVNLIFSGIILALVGFGSRTGEVNPARLAMAGVLYLIQIAAYATYEAWFLANKGATPGKMALGLRVVRASGGPISLGLGYGRFFARILDSLTLMIGYIMAAFDDQKRTLHDRIVDTRVIYK